MFRSRIVLVAVALGLGACASNASKYVPARHAEAHGHYSTQLAENRYRVVYNGDRRTGINATRDFALLRASEITLREGYDWFRVVDRETATEHAQRAGSSIGYERVYSVDETHCGLLSCTRHSRPVGLARMDLDTDRPVAKHSHALEIVMGKGQMPEDGGDYYDARSVSKSLVASK